MIVDCESCHAHNRLPAGRLNEVARCARCKHSLSPLSRPLDVASDAEFDELIASAPIPVLVDFWAAWCAPCRAVAPELTKLALQQAGRLVVAKVNTEALPGVASRFSIEAIPTMIRFDRGKPGKRLSGARSAPALARELGLPA